MGPTRNAVSGWRQPVVNATTGLFSHGPHPLANTMAYPGDPGLFGPGSATWPIMGDASVFVGAIRALLIQAAHPEVAAGVSQHSRYRDDPLGRLSRTSAYVTAVAFGAWPEVERAIAVVNRRHGPVAGVSARGRSYSADAADLGAWVHNSLTDSFLVSAEVFGPGQVPRKEADRFVAEQAQVGELLGVGPSPTSRAMLRSAVDRFPGGRLTHEQVEALEFLRRPPLTTPIRVAYGVLYRAAVATLPPSIRSGLGIRARRGAVAAGRIGVAGLRVALGPSPDWNLALQRVEAEELADAA